MRLGLANADVPRDPAALTDGLMAGWRARGIRGLVTHFHSVPPRDLGHKLADHDLVIFQYAGFNANLVRPRPDLATVIRDACRAAASVGAEMLIGGCGSHDPDNFYGPHPGNHEPSTVDRLVESLRTVAPVVADHGLRYALECHALTTLDSPSLIRDVLDRVDSPAVGANFDPVNLLGSVRAVHDNAGFVSRMADVLGDRLTPSAHIKDVRIGTDLVVHISEAPPGEGVLDYAAYFDAVRRLGDGAALVVEHLPAGQVPEALARVRALCAEHGVELA